MALLTAGSGRRYSPADLSLAEDLAARAGIAAASQQSAAAQAQQAQAEANNVKAQADLVRYKSLVDKE